MNELVEFLSRMKSGEVPSPANEAQTISVFVIPILRRLGWDDENPAEVEPQHATSSGFVDYCLTAGKHRVFIEVKKAGMDVEGGEEQLLRYCFDEGAELAVITNGEIWSFFLPFRREVLWRDRKFLTINIMDQRVKQAGEMLHTFLGKANVESNEALEQAEHRFEEGRKRAAVIEAAKRIPDAWKKLVSEPDERLVDLVREMVENLHKRPVGTDQIGRQIAEFLSGLSAPPLVAPTTPRRPRRTRRAPKTDSYIGRKPRAFVLRGKPAVEVRSWRELLTELSRLIHSNHKTEFSKCLKLRGTKKKYFSKGSPDSSMYGPHRIPGTSYYVETYYSAKDMVKRCHQLMALFDYKPSDLKIETL